MRNLKKNKKILGFKFSFCGRFSREEMATTEIFSYAAVPLNSLNLFIDYKLVGVILKDSYCGIKIWINRKKEKFLDLYFYSQNVIWNFLN
jgi:ribosomal protein S3